LTYYSIAQGSYYAGGGNFIRGGSQLLSDYLAQTIENFGGKVLLSHLVKKLIVENNKAVAVCFKNVNDKEEKLMTAYANEIIINASLPQLAEKLLDGQAAQELKTQMENKQIGTSLLSVYFGFDIDLKKFGHSYYSTFVFDESVKTMRDIGPNNQADFSKRGFTFIDYSQIDSNLAPEGKSVGVICAMDYLEDWANLSKDAYKTQKEKVRNIFIKRLDELIPGVGKHISYCEVGTSKTIERYTLNAQGAVYGFAQTPEHVGADKFNTLPNLHIASAWGKIGGGFSGAIYSGYLCAMDILRKR